MGNSQKLQELAELENQGIDELLDQAATDGLTPGICTNAGCDFTIDLMEINEKAGFCEHCNTDSVASAVMLAGIT